MENDEHKNSENCSTISVSETGSKYTLHGVENYVLAFLLEATENDPVVVFDWKADIMHSCVTWANENKPDLPVWFNAEYPLNENVIRMQILNNIAEVTKGGIHQNAILAPNSLTECGAVFSKLGFLCFDPFIIALCGNNRCPLATMFVVADGKRPTQAELTNFPAVPPWAVQAFK